MSSRAKAISSHDPTPMLAQLIPCCERIDPFKVASKTHHAIEQDFGWNSPTERFTYHALDPIAACR